MPKTKKTTKPSKKSAPAKKPATPAKKPAKKSAKVPESRADTERLKGVREDFVRAGYRPKRIESVKTSTRTTLVGEARAKLCARIEAFLQTPRSYFELATHSRVSDAQTRYALRALMGKGRIEKVGSRENTKYVAKPEKAKKAA